MKASRRTIFVRIGFAAAAVILAGGIHFIFDGFAWDRRFDEWAVARPVHLSVDLSKSGAYEAEFVQTCDIAHAQTIDLEPESPVDLPALRAAAGQTRVGVRFTRPGDESFGPHPYDAITRGPEDAVGLYRMTPVANGRYTVHVDIAAAETQRPIKATLVIRNELCGLERMPGVVSKGLGGVAIFLGVVVGITSLACRKPALAASVPPEMRPENKPQMGTDIHR